MKDMQNREYKLSEFYKANKGDIIWQVDALDENNECLIGPVLFSFDKKKIYNFWTDYPDNMTDEEVEIFDREQPYFSSLRSTKN